MLLKNKFSEKQFVLFGLNYIVGFGFIATISGVIAKGLWGMLIFVLTAFISMAVMLAFARGSQFFSNEVGGTYVYARKTFKKHKWFLFLQGWNQFAQVPLFSATTPLFFSTLLSEFDKGNQLIYQIASVSIFMIFIIISALGLKLSKWFVFFAAIIKWITIALGLAIVTYYSFMNFNFSNSFVNNEKVTLGIIISSVLTFIYAFAGGEGLAGLSSDVETKRFKKILMLIFIIVLSFYLVFYLIYLGLEPNTFKTSNSSVQFGAIYKGTFGLVGLILFTIGLFFNRASSSISSMIYYARTVVPLAEDGFIPSKFAKKSKNGEYTNAIIFSTIFALISMIIFTILPSILQVRDQFVSILNAGNIVFLMQYLFTLITIVTLSHKEKKFKLPLWEEIVYILAILLIGFVILSSFIPPIIGEQYTKSTAILLPSYVGVMLIGYIIWWIWYLINKKPGKKQLYI
ncbi:APC family permease [Mesomycoplasma molare]|uniref:APC family permease n=1 Tax=Mesomycoplasma molare TaxID=171288 RepID=A0ABY5TWH6_9BACT|nr:APC family permease [Mesomycoplasma molare]UWD34336.1 APC family permease [Mesomycoplasma molare]